MNLEILLIVIVALLGVLSFDPTKHLPEDTIDKIDKECKIQAYINYIDRPTTEEENEEIIKIYSLCIYKKTGLLTDDNKYNEEEVDKIAGNDQKLIERIRNCFTVETVTKKEIMQIHKCIILI
ncbi:unnamed protein product [Diabrotica balteata]|uniref:Uncharacterized protein n=1 Tax=Diabrotica balteata TaxID=107213 RepID=A0A9N9T225_DIABA|nr:unnamed protein product [Diabrotica balteata]